MNWDRLMYPLAAVVVGILLMANGGEDLLPMLKTAKDANTCDVSTLKKGDHVKLDISAAYSCVMSNATVDLKDDVEKTTENSRYYAIPLIEENENSAYIYSFLVVEVSKEQYSAMETATRIFNTWWEDKSGLIGCPDEVLTTVDGVLKPVKDTERAYIYDQFNDDEYGEYVVPYVLHATGKTDNLISFIIGTVVAIVGAVICIKSIAEDKKMAAAHTAAVSSGYYNVPQDVHFDHKPQ